MTITEFASLQLKHPYNLSSPPPRFTTILQRLAAEQSAFSGHPLLFFTDPAQPGSIHLITGWKDVAAHEASIAAGQNRELFGEMMQYLDVKGMVHLDMNFDEVPKVEAEMVCEKYQLAEGHAESEEEGPHGRKRWTGLGRNVDPNAGDAIVKFTVCSEANRTRVWESATQNREVLLLRRLHLDNLG